MINLIKRLVLTLCLLASFTAVADIYDDAVTNENRSKKDRGLDGKRKPADVLRFFEIKPGMKVFDVFAGGGYYSEILSVLVGEKGGITLYNNEPWDKFVGKAVNARLKDNRLANVKRLVATPESLITHNETYDAAIFVLGMHDLYYADPKSGWVAVDKAKFLKGIYKILKKSAVFGVIDANAKAGADNEQVGKKLHRVDPKAVIKDILAAGFTLESRSDILANKNDDLVTSVFTPENRYNTDRSVLKFRK